MRKILSILFIILSFGLLAQGVAINTDGSNPNSSSILDVKSNSKGILIPRMTLSERNSISSPASGLLVYQTNGTSGFYFYDGSWVRLATGTDATYTSGSGISVAGNVISNTSPDQTVSLTGGGSTTITGTYPNFTVTSTDNNSGGTVTSVSAGTGLSGGTITSTGTISMPNVGTAGTYGSATQVPVLTTDDQGRVTGVTNTTISGVAPSAGSSNYIQNGTSTQASSNFNISGNGTLGGDINVNGSDINGPGISGGSNGILRINSNTDIRVALDSDNNGNQQFEITPNGTTTAVFSVTEAGNVTANGTIRTLETGSTPTLYSTLQSADLTANRTITLPDATGTAAVSASGNIALSATGNITFTGTLPPANGGTGASTVWLVSTNANSTMAATTLFCVTTANVSGSNKTLTFPAISTASGTDGRVLYLRNAGSGSYGWTLTAAAGNTLSFSGGWVNAMVATEALVFVAYGNIWYMVSDN